MITSLEHALRAHLRLVILRLLTEIDGEQLLRGLILRLLLAAPAYALSLAVLADVLRRNGVSPGGDRIAVAAAWLVETGLAAAAPGLTPLLALTNRGLDVAEEAVAVPGVAPLPSAAWLAARLPDAGINAGREEVTAALAFLRDAGLIHIDDDMVLPRQAAAEVVAGRRQVDGVHTPSPASVMQAAAKAAKALLVRG